MSKPEPVARPPDAGACGATLPASLLDLIAQHAEGSDETGRIHPAVLEAVRASRLLAGPIPDAFEGQGWSALQVTQVLRDVAVRDAALALALNMHLFSVAVIVEHWKIARDKAWILLEAIATQRRIVASAFAEPGLGGNVLRSRCRGRTVRGGFEVSGVKTPCSLLVSSDLVCLQFETREPAPRIKVALLPTDAPGLQIERTWDAVAMRASESDTLRLDACFIPDDLVFYNGEPGADHSDLFSRSMGWFCLGVAATYAGAASQALQQLRTPPGQSRSWSSRLETSAAQVLLGAQVRDLMVLDAAIVGLAARLDDPAADAAELFQVALATKDHAAQVCPRVVDASLQLQGAGGLMRANPLSRLVRDVRAAPFHPPSSLAAQQILGRSFLGRPFELELTP